MRATIRVSLDGDTTGNVTVDLSNLLTSAGFRKVGTATYEHPDINDAAMSVTMAAFWTRLANAPAGVTLDHIWSYATNHVPPPF